MAPKNFVLELSLLACSLILSPLLFLYHSLSPGQQGLVPVIATATVLSVIVIILVVALIVAIIIGCYYYAQ